MRHFFLLVLVRGRGLRTALYTLSVHKFTNNLLDVLVLPDGFVEHALQVSLGESGAFKVLLSLDFFGYSKSLLVGDRFHLLGSKALGHILVLSQIQLCTDENDGNIRSMVFDFGVPLCDFSLCLI